MDLAALTAAGLYDPDSPTAGERRALLEFLIEQGCTIEEMRTAHDRGRLFALAGDRIVRPGRDRYPLRDVAAQLGAELEVVQSAWRAMGLVEPNPDDPVASDSDVDMLRVFIEMGALLGTEAALGLARVAGAAIARIGDASSTAVRGRMPDMSVALSGSELTTAQTFAAVASYAPRIGQALDTLYRHHLETARMHFERTESWEVAGAGGIRLGVGFADLCGFTGLTQQLSLDDLSQLLTRFEEVACDVVYAKGGRLVKFIGDAVMFVGTDPATTAGVAEALLDAATQRGMTARAGVTAGTVLALDGDYFGPVVNLAARLVALAQPGELLVSDAVVQRLDGSREVESLGPQQIRGFTESVAVARLLPATSP